MKILTVVGARPQFIKAFVVSRAVQQMRAWQHIVVHTGQHYDYAMSASFFAELELPEPDYNLGVGSGSHGAQTAAMLIGIEQILLDERPDVVIVHGDTNSTLAGALAAAKLHMPVAHVEAGLRSFRRDMPEETNRVLVDHLAELLFAPTEAAVRNLDAEGVRDGVLQVGDVMYDALLLMQARARKNVGVLRRLAVEPGQYGLATIHRAANTDDPVRLRHLVDALGALDRPIVFPVHPRTRRVLDASDFVPLPSNVVAIEPVGYLDMLALQVNARCILTDSGGVQKEAYLLNVPCVTLREETEWVETLADGWNVLCGDDRDAIRAAWGRSRPSLNPPAVFGNGDAGPRIVAALTKFAARGSAHPLENRSVPNAVD